MTLPRIAKQLERECISGLEKIRIPGSTREMVGALYGARIVTDSESSEGSREESSSRIHAVFLF